MAEAQYLYRISLDASGAASSARTFAQTIQQELGAIKVGPLDTKAFMKSLDGLKKAAAQAGGAAGKQMSATMQKQMQVKGRLEKWGFGGYLEQQGMDLTQSFVPSKRIVQELSGLENKFGEFRQKILKVGVSPEEWLGVGPGLGGQFEQRMMALQAAQRRVWGIRGMGAQMQQYGRAGMAAGGAVLGGAGMAAKQYGEFAAPMGRAARNLELNAAMTAELDSELRKLAGTMSVFSPEEQAEGLYQWVAATGEVVTSTREMDSLLGRVGDVQKLAALGMVDYSVAVQAVTDVQAQYQLGVGETESIVATFIKVAATSKAEVGDLAEAFKYAGTFAAQTNTTFEETAAIFQLLSAYGQRGSMAGRGLARLMEGLIAPSKQAKAAMDELFKAAYGRTDVLIDEGKFVGMANAIKILAQATESLTEAERAQFVAKITTQNAARILLPLLDAEIEARKRGVSAIEENQKIIENMADSHTDTYAQMMKDVMGYEVSQKSAMDTLTDQWDTYLTSTDGRLKMTEAAYSSAITTIGQQVMTVALPAMEMLADVMRGIAQYAETHPGAVQSVLAGATLVIAVSALVAALGAGLRIFADYKALAMAASFQKSINQFGVEVATLLAGMQRQQLSSVVGGITGAAGRNAATGGAGIAAAGFGTGGATAAAAGGIGALGIGAIVTGLALAAGMAINFGAELQTGKTALDLMSTKAEALAAGMKAAVEAADMLSKAKPGEERADTEAEITELEAQIERLEAFLERGRKLRYPARERGEKPSPELEAGRAQFIAAVPERFVGPSGEVSLGLLEQELAEVNAALAKYQEALDGIAQAEADAAANAWLYTDAIESGIEALYKMQQAEQLGPRGFEPEGMVGIEDPGAMMSRYVEPTEKWAVSLGDLEEGFQDAGTAARRMQLYEVADAMGIGTAQSYAFADALDNLENRMQGFTGPNMQVAMEQFREWGHTPPSFLELAGQMGGQAKGGFSQATKLLGIGWDADAIMGTFDTYLAGLADTYAQAETMGRWQGELLIQSYNDAYDDIVSGHIDTENEKTKATEKAIKDRVKMYEDAEKGLRGIVEAQLKPTDVTAEDVAATEAGVYQDKWDEAARQMRAAMAGSAEWREMIPEGVWAQGGDAAYKWGQNWINEFYAGMHPDSVNWNVLLDNIENALMIAAGQSDMVDEVIARLAERGVTASSEQVLAALGMTGMIPPGMAAPGIAGGIGAATPEAMEAQVAAIGENIIGPLTTQLAGMDMSAPAQALVGSMDKGISQVIGKTPWSVEFQQSIKEDMAKNRDTLVGAGQEIGKALWDGVYKAFEEANIVHVIAQKVISIINQEKDI